MIEFYRGDTYSFKFQRKRNGEVVTELPNKIYFTVKASNYSNKFIFQKSLENGITVDEDNYYHVLINPEDTNGLLYSTYYYDIEVITDTYKKTIASGELKFKEETTLPENEV